MSFVVEVFDRTDGATLAWRLYVGSGDLDADTKPVDIGADEAYFERGVDDWPSVYVRSGDRELFLISGPYVSSNVNPWTADQAIAAASMLVDALGDNRL